MNPQIQLVAKQPEAAKADVIVALVDAAPESCALLSSLDGMLGGGLFSYLKDVEFSWDKGGLVQVPTLGRISARNLVLVGLKNKDGGETARISAEAALTAAIATGVRAALALKPESIAILPGTQSDMGAVGLGAALGVYKFERYFAPPKKPVVLASVQVLLGAVSAVQKRDFAQALLVADGVNLARDLVNEPPNVLTPEALAARARLVAKKHKFTAKILDDVGIQKAGMNLHYAVGKGSVNVPYFIHLTYRPLKPTGSIAFIGKGITFDSGGLCIKPGASMPEMKTDMAGAAAVLGLMEAVAAQKPNIEVHGIIGAAENMLDAKSYRPADVITGLSGKTVEVINTDAEGRMVLADALTYAARLEPDLMVDAATLTGATLISLGPACSAFFTGDEAIVSAMKTASASAGESFWHMPLIEELAQQLKSEIADLKHTGDRSGGAITASLFLREFTHGVPWMHCDIPGAVFRDRPSGMHPKGATGHAVLTFLKLIELHASKPIVLPRKATKPAKPEHRKAPEASSTGKGATRAKAARAGASSTKRRRAAASK